MDLRADLLADITDMLEEKEEEEEYEDEEEEEYKFSRVVEDVNDELLNELLDVYDNFNKMSYQEWVVCYHFRGSETSVVEDEGN